MSIWDHMGRELQPIARATTAWLPAIVLRRRYDEPEVSRRAVRFADWLREPVASRGVVFFKDLTLLIFCVLLWMGAGP